MTPKELAEGLRLADAATPGPWKYDNGNGQVETLEWRVLIAERVGNLERKRDAQGMTAYGYPEVKKLLLYDNEDDMEFIAWSNPQRIKELILAAQKLEELRGIFGPAGVKAVHEILKERDECVNRLVEVQRARLDLSQERDELVTTNRRQQGTIKHQLKAIEEFIAKEIELKAKLAAFHFHGTDDCKNWDECDGRITLFHLGDRECITCSNNSERVKDKIAEVKT